jgi:UDPglucose--hexose-1-phosphate uridylyltransferase
MGSELRQDYFGNYVLIAKNREFRPKHFIRTDKTVKKICPFCPGNEKLTPPETDRVEVGGKWVFRSFPNKFPFTPVGEVHEVIVEARGHSKRLSDFGLDELVELFHFYQRRINRVKGYAYLLKNEGSTAGASIPHSHSQLVTLPKKPKIISVEKRVLDFKDIRTSEKSFVISDDKHSFSYCPKASKYPLEAWIVCKRSGSNLRDLSVKEMESVSKKLLFIMKKLDVNLKNPAFNLFHHDSGPDYHIHVIPRISVLAGMEMGLDTFVNSVPPEEGVRFYKK